MLLFDPQSLEGKQIDQFRLDQYIARGAMGLVYKAHDTILQRTVAIKLIPKTEDPDATKDDAGRRLIREAQAAGRLSHPGIVTVFAYGETPQFRYISMEYVPGRTLAEYLRERKQLDVDQVIDITIQILLALDAANREGVVHRDIKPSNVMLSEGGRVKVMDFGIAKLASLSMTATGTVLGTPYYMSPEQIMGQKVDIRSDIFSTGAVMYQLLTGERPFEADSSSALIYKILHADPLPAHDVSGRIPYPLSDIINKALSKNPAQRFQTPREMLKTLEEAVHAPPAENDYAATIVVKRPPSEQGAPAGLQGPQPVSPPPQPGQAQKPSKPVVKEIPTPDRPPREEARADSSVPSPGAARPDRTVPPAGPKTAPHAEPSGPDHPVDAPPRISKAPAAGGQPSPLVPKPFSEPEDEFPEDQPESYAPKKTPLRPTAPPSARRPSRVALALLATTLGVGFIVYFALRGPTQAPVQKPVGSPAPQPVQPGAARVDPASPPTGYPPPVETARSAEQQKAPGGPDPRSLMHTPKETYSYQDSGQQGAKPTEPPAPNRAPTPATPPVEERAKGQPSATTTPEASRAVTAPKETAAPLDKSGPDVKPAEPPPVRADASSKDAQTRVQLLLAQAERSSRNGLITSPEGASAVSYYREAFAINDRSPEAYESVLTLAESSLSNARKAARNNQTLSAKAYVDKAEKLLQVIPQPPLAQYEPVLVRMKQDIANVATTWAETPTVKPSRAKAPSPPPAKPAAKPGGKPGQPGILTEDFNAGAGAPSTGRPAAKPKSSTSQPGILNETFR